MKNLLFTTALTSCLLAAPAHAQSTSRAAIDDEITVTAQRREQAPQDVGIALNVISGDALIEQGVTRINGLEDITPSLEIENQFGGGQPSFSIRGVGFRDYATLNAPTVGVYVDDVAYPIPVMTQGVLFDVERVEILRGPQGTLYGRNTTGGAIKIISAKPTETFAAGLVVEGGRFGRVDAEAFVSGPVSETVRVRLSGTTAHGGDWQVNRETGEEIGAMEQYALRGIAEIDLTENILALVNLHGFIDKSDGRGLQLFNDSLLDATALAHAGRRETSYGSSAEFATLVGITPGQHPFRDNEGWGGNLTLTAGLGGADLTYIGSFETLNRKEFNDWDALTVGGAGVYFETSAEVMAHELRLSGDTGNGLRWVGGFYYADEDLNELYQSDFAASFGPGFAVTTPYQQDVRTLAAYVHADVDLTETVTLLGGLRYEDENRELNNLGTFATGFGALNFANGSTDFTLENRSLEAENISGKIGVDIKPLENLLLYASYSRGVKSGGFTAYNTLNPNALDPFRPEKLNAYEIGFKTQLANDAISVNAAVFYYDYNDQQVQSAIFDPATNAIVGRIVNAPKSEIYGGELEITFTPAPWLTIGQSLGYKAGEFKEFTDLDTGATGASGMAVFIDRAGQPLGFPEVSYLGFAEIRQRLSEIYSTTLRVDYSYRDALSLPLLGPDYRVDDYWLTNAQLTFGPHDGRWELAFWGRNILNADYDETRNFFIAPGGVADIAAPGMPATYGARVSVHY